MLKPFVAVSAVAVACSSFLIASQARAQAPDPDLPRVAEPGTLRAVNTVQQAKGLPVDPRLDAQTVATRGVKVK